MSEEDKNSENTENNPNPDTEDISKNQTDQKVQNEGIKPKKSFIGKFFTVVKYIFIFIILLVIGIFIFIQTDIFSNLALDIALDKLNESFSEKETVIHAESLNGNLLKGFTLNNGSIKVKGDTLLKFSSLFVKYDILKLLKQEIFTRELILKDPQINLTKIRGRNDSLKWNFEYFLESETPDDDTTSSEFDWGITAENLIIENGSVRILENKNSALPIRDIPVRNIDTFNVSELDMNKFNLNLSAKYFPEDKEVNIKNLNFKTNSPLNLNQFSLQANINYKDTITELSKLTLLTDRSDIKINQIRIKGVNALEGFDYEGLENKDTKINIEADPINMDDLSFFLPELDFLDSTISFSLVTEDKYGDLNLKKLNLKSEKSQYYFSGNIKNLHNPESLYFNVTGKDIIIDPRDTKILLPGLDIPDYTHMGIISIPSLTYTGEPSKFETDFDINTSAGRTYGNAFMDLTGNDIVYKGDFKTSGLNPGKIFKDKELEGQISGDFNVDARGFDYKTMSGKLNYKLISTKMFGVNISESGGRLIFNRGNIDLDLGIRSNIVNARTKGKINISNPDNISYDLRGTASNLDIQAITKDPSLKSNLTFDFDINGKGTSPDDIAGNFKIDLKPSEFGENTLPVTPINAVIDQSGNLRKISLKTNFADVEAEGFFKFSELMDLVIENSGKIASNISDKFFPDSLRVTPTENTGYQVDCNSYYMNYSVNVTDLSPIASFTGNDTIIFNGNLKGSISDSCGLFTFNTSGKINNFAYGDSLIILKDADLNLIMSDAIGADNLENFYTDITLNSNKVIAAGNSFDSVFTKINFFNNENRVSVTANRDSTVKLFTDFSLKDSAVFQFDSLSLRYHEFHLANNSDLQVKYTKIDSNNVIDFRKFILSSLNQRLNVSGFYSTNDSSNLKVSADNIKVFAIQKLMNPGEDIDTVDLIKGNLRRTVITLKGLPDDKIITLESTSDVLSIGGTQIGRLDALIDYKDELITSDVAFYNINNAGSFKLQGTFPVLDPGKEEYADTVYYNKVRSEAAVNLAAKADNFQLKIFQQLLPFTREVEGILNGEIRLGGKTAEPDLTGEMNLSKGKVYVTLNKMRYDLEADFSTENEKILLKNSKLFVEDDPSRFITTTGYIDLTDLNLTDMDLKMSGDVKAFDKDNGPTELGFSGDLWVGSGSPQLRIMGNSDRIDLTGNLILVRGNLEFNPFIQEAYNIYTDDFEYGVIIDSVNSSNESVRRVLRNITDSVIVIKDLNLNPFE